MPGTTPSNAIKRRSDKYEAPLIIGSGAPFPSRTITDTLTPELVFKEAGTVSYIHIYEENSPFTLETAYSKRNPILVSRMLTHSLIVPKGTLKPDNSYYWYVESIYNPGATAECVKTSKTLYFSTSKDAK